MYCSIFLRIKFVTYENNLIIGKANKYLLPFAKKIFVSSPRLDNISEKYKKKSYCHWKYNKKRNN